MADNTTVTAGSGTTIATDNIAGVHYQRVKQALGADGSNIGDQGGAVVDTTAGAAFVRERPDVREFTPTVTVDTAAYTAGDCMGGLITVASVVAQAGNWFRLNRILAIGKVEFSGLTAFIFNDNPSATTFTDNAAFPTIDSADLTKLRGFAVGGTGSYSGIYMMAFDRIWQDALPDIPLVGTSLYLALKVTGAPDFVASSDFKLVLSGERL